jgi:hypothetical protein
VRLSLTLLFGLGGAACVAPVAFVCDDDAPLCAIQQVIDDHRSLARGIRVERVSIYQGLEVDLMRDRASLEPDLSIVAGRDAWVRVFVEPVEGFRERVILARVRFERDGETVAAAAGELWVRGASTHGQLESTINVQIPGTMIPAGTLDWSVELLEASDEVREPGQAVGVYPGAGTARFSVVDAGAGFKVHLVPIVWNADGSGRAPQVGESALDHFRDEIGRVFPTSQVLFDVGDPFPWDQSVDTGTGWSSLLSEMAALRRERNIPGDVYIYGVFDPGPNYAGAILGLSMVAMIPEHEVGRSSIGISRGVGHGGDTMAHELGHAAGRAHAPCGGASGPDPDFPYPQARIGRWGLHAQWEMLLDPQEHADFMSYCGPKWVSDYNWELLLERQLEINVFYGLAQTARVRREPWRMVWAHEDKTMVDGGVFASPKPPVGDERWVRVEVDGREVELRGVWTPFPHVDGGVWHLPWAHEGAPTRIRVEDEPWVAVDRRAPRPRSRHPDE